VLVELQMGSFLSCNSSDKNYKNYMPRVATEVLSGIATEVLVMLQLGAY
jgi:hypothetical protein